MRVCPRCEEEKPLSDYHKNRAKANGRHSYCKACNAARAKVFSSSRRGKKLRGDYQRAYALKKLYGLTIEQYNELLSRQNHRCAICERHQDEFKIRFAVDHIHSGEGWIRGLLCYTCNRHVVGRHTDPDLFRKAADYLDQHTEYKVPPDFIKPKRRRRKKRKK